MKNDDSGENCIASTPQPPPKRGGRSCTILVVEDLMKWSSLIAEERDGVINDLIARDKMGFAKYGQNLETHDGRNTLADAYQEALDLTQYLRKYREECCGPELQSIYFHALIACLRIREAIDKMPGSEPSYWIDVETDNPPEGFDFNAPPMFTCHRCGRAVEGTKYCPYCGTEGGA